MDVIGPLITNKNTRTLDNCDQARRGYTRQSLRVAIRETMWDEAIVTGSVVVAFEIDEIGTFGYERG